MTKAEVFHFLHWNESLWQLGASDARQGLPRNISQHFSSFLLQCVSPGQKESYRRGYEFAIVEMTKESKK